MKQSQAYDNEPEPSVVGQKCRDYFKSGYYCAESVLLAVAGENGIPTEGLSRIVTGMCGGVSRSGGMCGALLGGTAAIGLLFGRDTPADEKMPTFSLTYRLAKEFEKEFGSINCYGVLSCDISSKEGSDYFEKQKLGSTYCPEVAEKAAVMTQEIINNCKDCKHPLLSK